MHDKGTGAIDMATDERKNIKVNELTYQMLFNTAMIVGQVTGKRSTYDALIQEALLALAERSDLKRAFLPDNLQETRKRHEGAKV
jgi:hypothetical protein